MRGESCAMDNAAGFNGQKLAHTQAGSLQARPLTLTLSQKGRGDWLALWVGVCTVTCELRYSTFFRHPMHRSARKIICERPRLLAYQTRCTKEWISQD